MTRQTGGKSLSGSTPYLFGWRCGRGWGHRD